MDQPQVKIDPKFQELIPPLNENEYKLLETSLLSEGCRDALVVWNGILLDGHNRLKICKANDIPYEVRSINNILDRDTAKFWIINNQLSRRNLNKYQRAELGLRLKPLLVKEAEERQLGGLKQFDTPVVQNSEQRGKTRDKLAEAAGVSYDTIYRVDYISQRADEDTKDSLRKGDTSINREYKKLKSEDDVVKREEYIRNQRGGFPGKAIIYEQDAIDFLNNIDDQSIDLLLTDPPYSTDVDDISGFVKNWVPLALSKIKPTGRAYICTGAYPRELKAYLDIALREQNFDLNALLVWTYKNAMGPAPRLGYHLNWQSIFYFVGPDAPDLDAPKLTEREAVHELHVPRPSKDIWQKPDELADRFIRHSTKVNDTIIDPFAGTGTFVRMAAELGRNGIGADNDPHKIAICREDGLKCR